MKTLGNSRQVEKEGNTDTSFSKKQPSRKTFYCFTLHNYENIFEDVIRQLQKISKKRIVGKEICPTTGNKHLQGFVALNKPMRITELKISGNPHFEPCIASEEANVKYCSKEGDYIKWGFPKPLKIIENLFDWQKEIVSIVDTEPDDRKVYWYWSSKGNLGKSAFCKYLVATKNAVPAVSGKYADIINLIFNSDMDKCNCICFDIPRNNRNAVSYSAIESIKNGMVVNTKYETGYKMFNPPHIFVFCNEPPEVEKLSSDRWVIKCLDNSFCETSC